MIDTHAHLIDPSFEKDLPDVLQRAKDAGVQAIFCMSETASEAEVVMNLHEKHPNFIRACVGLHPERATPLMQSELNEELGRIETFARRFHESSLVALGETGLDFTPHVLSLFNDNQSNADFNDGKDLQRHVFAKLINLSSELNLPLSVHSRGAGHHALRMLTEYQQQARACMHAFDGRAIHAERALEISSTSSKTVLFFSVPPCVVRSDSMAKLVRRLPLHRLLFESDAPALAPVAGTRNEPAEILRSLNMIAGLKGVSVDHVRGTIERNTRELFTRF